MPASRSAQTAQILLLTEKNVDTKKDIIFSKVYLFFSSQIEMNYSQN